MDSNNIRSFEDIFSTESLFGAWQRFRQGKKAKEDIYQFELKLIHNLISVCDDIVSSQYRHGGYKHFKISDPKPRDIHKASVRDRVIHHAVYTALYSYFDSIFIYDSYSCRNLKGTHRAIERFEKFSKDESLNHTRTLWVLKCDIKKCFASVDQTILKNILREHIKCNKTFTVLEDIIDSFNSGIKGRGIPLGNLTSQLFINIYLNKFDQYIKKLLRVKKYIRYADDFVILSRDKDWLLELVPKIADFLDEELNFTLHPNKVILKTVASGIDFLGWTHFSKHRVLRTKTKNRMFKKIEIDPNEDVINSYLGLLKHGDTYDLQKSVRDSFGSDKI
jgi:retron-type reverse transcriptase